jgi:signal transduction histidine kinase
MTDPEPEPRIPLDRQAPPTAGTASGPAGPPPAERDALLTRLARGLAHEIKNPLSTMAMNLALLEEEWTRGGGEPSPTERRSLKRVRTLQREVSRLEGILEDFLRFARGGQVNRSPGDLVALVREVLEFMEPELATHEIALHAELPASLPMVVLDPGAFRQALINLLVNARQAMPGGGELIVQVRRHGPSVEVSITDTGVGMDPETLEHCFDLYWSTKKGGTGLGLSTVSRIVAEHEGTISVVSEEGRGTSITIRLPLLQEVAGRPDEDETSA